MSRFRQGQVIQTNGGERKRVVVTRVLVDGFIAVRLIDDASKQPARIYPDAIFSPLTPPPLDPQLLNADPSVKTIAECMHHVLKRANDVRLGDGDRGVY